ncbi:MAG: hypothetical protein PHC61_00660 [Chitinivibrionales bacterium]|nr:hypothetical protein [Chitinivibrionales bacterium]
MLDMAADTIRSADAAGYMGARNRISHFVGFGHIVPLGHALKKPTKATGNIGRFIILAILPAPFL